MTHLPKAAGIGLKAEHCQALLDQPNAVAWLEIHPENYMGRGGPPHHYLSALREQYPLSMHGVGMSLGDANGVCDKHLSRLKTLVGRYQPSVVSEHLSWSHWNEVFMNDLLPLPYTKESLQTVVDNVNKVQNTLGQKILIENPSSYLDFKHSDLSETEFLSELVSQCGCGLLLDINNVFVSAENNQFDPYQYIADYPKDRVEEIHLAGHSVQSLPGNKTLRIDDHGSAVKLEVWELYEYFFTLSEKPISTLIEWDTNIPEFVRLIEEAKKSEQHMHAALNRSEVSQ